MSIFLQKGRQTTIFSAFVFAIAFSLFAPYLRAALLNEMYVNASSPLFAEIPVCLDNFGETVSGYTVEIVGNEQFDENDQQPFIENLQYNLDQINNIDAILTLTSELPLPDGLQLIITLLDEGGGQIDSQMYSGFGNVRQTPDEFDCEQYLRITEEVIVTPEPTGDQLPFIIDIIDRDTWRNIAVFVNAAWYGNRFSIEQVMSSLYQNNAERAPVVRIPGSMYALPERLEIPGGEATARINQQAAMAFARLLDGSGSFRVERRKAAAPAPAPAKPKRDLNKEEIEKLRNELSQLRDQLALLSAQLSDSAELLHLRNDELEKLQAELVNTRGRIATLERANLELQNRGIGYYLKESLKTPWPWLLLGLIIVLFVLQGMAARQRREDYARLQRQINQRDNQDQDGTKKKITNKKEAAAPIIVEKDPEKEKSKSIPSPVVATPAIKETGKRSADADRRKDAFELSREDAPKQDSGNIPTLKAQQSKKDAPSIESGDELRAQLDLANAYLSMGDKEEARQLLADLVNCDDAKIRHEAVHMLDKL